MNPLFVAILAVFLIVVLSKTASGVHHLNSDTLQAATILYNNMVKWQAEGQNSKSLLLARDSLTTALANANILRTMLDDIQTQKLFKVNMKRVIQDIQRELNTKTKALYAKYPTLNPSQVGIRKA